MSENTRTFTGEDKKHYTYPNPNVPPYNVDCERCKGKGHIHCEVCGEHTKCPQCGGSGKKNIFQGNVYRIWWNVPTTEFPKLEVSC